MHASMHAGTRGGGALCRTILGLLSVLKNTARKGTVISEVTGDEHDERVAGLACALRSWRLASPWLAAPAHTTCTRAVCRPCVADPGAADPPRRRTACRTVHGSAPHRPRCVQGPTPTGSAWQLGRP